MKEFILVGSGWRANFYRAVAYAFPEEFHLACWWFHSPDKAKVWKGMENSTGDFEQALSIPHDFVVLALSDAALKPYLLTLMARKETILTETSFYGLGKDDLREILMKKGGNVSVSEQYHDYPYFREVKKLMPLLGDVTECRADCVHSHHASSLLYTFLGTRGEDCRTTATKRESAVTATGSRAGSDISGRTKTMTRLDAVFSFASGKTGYTNFSPEQYRGSIRSSHFALYGTRGELYDDHFRYLDEGNHMVEKRLDVAENGILVDGKLDEPMPYRASQDHSAILRAMREAGKGYPLEDAIEDALLAQSADESARERKEIPCIGIKKLLSSEA
jgi:predicted dehydrogenase